MPWPGATAGSAEVASTSANSASVNSTDQRADTATPPHRPSRMPVPNPPPRRCAAADVGLLGFFISGLVTTLLVSPGNAHRQTPRTFRIAKTNADTALFRYAKPAGTRSMRGWGSSCKSLTPRSPRATSSRVSGTSHNFSEAPPAATTTDRGDVAATRRCPAGQRRAPCGVTRIAAEALPPNIVGHLSQPSGRKR